MRRLGCSSARRRSSPYSPSASRKVHEAAPTTHKTETQGRVGGYTQKHTDERGQHASVLRNRHSMLPRAPK